MQAAEAFRARTVGLVPRGQRLASTTRAARCHGLGGKLASYKTASVWEK